MQEFCSARCLVMIWPNPRYLLLFCAGFDLFGLLALLVAIGFFKQPALLDQLPWVLFTVIAYLGLGWLFGSYTVLRWLRLPPVAVLQRVLITAVVTVIMLALVRLLFNPEDSVWLVHRSTQAIWLPPLVLWSVLLRVLLRRGLLVPASPQWFWLVRQLRCKSLRLLGCVRLGISVCVVSALRKLFS